jgi:hypothetical protein
MAMMRTLTLAAGLLLASTAANAQEACPPPQYIDRSRAPDAATAEAWGKINNARAHAAMDCISGQSRKAMDIGYCVIDGFDHTICEGPTPAGGKEASQIPVEDRRNAGMTAADDARAIRVGQCILAGGHDDDWCRRVR